MTTLQITINEPLAEAIREKARQSGLTPEAWLADVAAQRIQNDGNAWIDRFLELADKHPGNSGGATWQREDLYER